MTAISATDNTPDSTDDTSQSSAGERADLLAALAQARFFLRHTARDLNDEQAAARPTVSALSIGGLIKHVADAERNWARFLVEGPTAVAASPDKDLADWTAADFAEREKGFQLLPTETLAGVLSDYSAVAEKTDKLVRSLPSLDVSIPLPADPWFTEPAWSARRVVMNIIAETAQHSGHADIIRETIDGAKSMG